LAIAGLLAADAFILTAGRQAAANTRPSDEGAIGVAFESFLKTYVQSDSAAAYSACVDLPIAIPKDVIAKHPGLRPISECLKYKEVTFIDGQSVPRLSCYISHLQVPMTPNDVAVQCTNFRGPLNGEGKIIQVTQGVDGKPKVGGVHVVVIN
jgi:hypothetical protein